MTFELWFSIGTGLAALCAGFLNYFLIKKETVKNSSDKVTIDELKTKIKEIANLRQQISDMESKQQQREDVILSLSKKVTEQDIKIEQYQKEVAKLRDDVQKAKSDASEAQQKQIQAEHRAFFYKTQYDAVQSTLQAMNFTVHANISNKKHDKLTIRPSSEEDVNNESDSAIGGTGSDQSKE